MSRQWGRGRQRRVSFAARKKPTPWGRRGRARGRRRAQAAWEKPTGVLALVCCLVVEEAKKPQADDIEGGGAEEPEADGDRRRRGATYDGVLVLVAAGKKPTPWKWR